MSKIKLSQETISAIETSLNEGCRAEIYLDKGIIIVVKCKQKRQVLIRENANA